MRDSYLRIIQASQVQRPEDEVWNPQGHGFMAAIS